MTTNIERAADVIDCQIGVSGNSPKSAAQALAAAGLLAPDMTEPTIVSDVPEWETPSNENRAVSIEDGHLRIWGDLPALTVTDARELADALLSAAAYAEEHTDDQ